MNNFSSNARAKFIGLKSNQVQINLENTNPKEFGSYSQNLCGSYDGIDAKKESPIIYIITIAKLSSLSNL